MQQKGVTIRDCKLENTSDEYSCSQSAIAVYDSDTIIEGCIIDHLTPVPITVGVNNSEITRCANIIIRANQIKSRGHSWQGAISFAGRAELIEDVIISDNIIECYNYTDKDGNTESAIQMSGRFRNVIISNNKCNGCRHGVLVIQKAETEEYLSTNGFNFENIYDGLIISDNIFTTNNVSVLVQFIKKDDGSSDDVTRLNVTGNICNQIRYEGQSELNYRAKNSVARIIGSGYAPLSSNYYIANNSRL